MNITMIGCPFQTSFGGYIDSLRTAIGEQTGGHVRWVGSNCGCGDPVERDRLFQARDCEYFDMPIPSGFRSETPWKRHARDAARNVTTYLRARRYSTLSAGSDIVHFHQILNAYGSLAVFHWLRRPSLATRVVTVHELDSDQLDSSAANATYNRAGAVIVHCEEMRERMVQLGIEKDRIHVILHGTTLPLEPPGEPRNGLVFYGGHKLMSGKGVTTLFQAMAILERRMPLGAPVLNIHGHYGTVAPDEGLRLAHEYGVAGRIRWMNQISELETIQLYQRSLACILPYTGSFGGYAAATAAACRLPVIGTRRAGLPDHLGPAGIWVDEENPEQVADCVARLSNDPAMRCDIQERLRKRAEDFLGWEVIAGQTLKVYREAQAMNQAALRRTPMGSPAPPITSSLQILN